MQALKHSHSLQEAKGNKDFDFFFNFFYKTEAFFVKGLLWFCNFEVLNTNQFGRIMLKLYSNICHYV